MVATRRNKQELIEHSWQKRMSELAVQPKTRAYSQAVFSFLAVSIFGLYAILPTIKTILFLKREIVDKTVVNQQMEDKISALIESQATHETTGEKLFLVSEAIPQTAQPIELTRSLHNFSKITIASASSLQIASVPLIGSDATTSGTPGAGPPSFPLTMVSSGPYSSLKALIDGIVNLRRMLTIESIRFTPSTEATSALTGVNLQVVLQLKAYYQNP